EVKEETTYEPVDLRVAYMANMGSASSLVAAKEYGYFDKYGLNVELFKFSNGPDEISAMASGDIDISQIGHGAHKLCIQDKAVIFQMDATSLADMVMGNTERGVSTLADLKGKKIASTLGTSADIILKLALEDAGLTEDDVEIIEMDPNGVVPAMVSGQIDACATWSPGTETIKEKMGDKVVVLADNSTYLDKATFPSSFITTKDYAGKNRDVLVRFAAAIQEAQDDRNSDKLEDIAKKVAALTEIDESVMLVSMNEGNWTTSGATFFKDALKDGSVKNFYLNQQKLFLDAGAIDEEVPVENYVMLDVMEEANELATQE
ncbi:MAG: ABC transporter substrate-binding protein, partial [Tissierellia bacterium]|nr:ABC transporter substrate-binding protein [Tissierellia bacterium]